MGVWGDQSLPGAASSCKPWKAKLCSTPGRWVTPEIQVSGCSPAMRLKCNHVNVSQQLKETQLCPGIPAGTISPTAAILAGHSWGTTIRNPIHLEPSKHSLAVRVLEHQHRLPTGCGISSLEMSKSHPDLALGTLLWMALLEKRLGQASQRAQPASAALWFFKGKADKKLCSWGKLSYKVLSRRSYFALWEIQLQNVSGKSCQLWIINCPKEGKEAGIGTYWEDYCILGNILKRLTKY